MAMFLNTPLPYKRYKKISETTYFVDKSLILNDIFGCMEEETQYICITRPRRFGKTIMANMLGAFFGRVWDASQIFDHLKIADSPEYHQYLNQYDIIYIDFSRLPENCTSYRQYIDRIITGLKNDLAEAYPEYQTDSIYALWDILSQISEQTDRQFVFIMDEWDAVFHLPFITEKEKAEYILFLKTLLKDQDYTALAYITGILPISKYSSGSELNMFMEFKMTSMEAFSEYFGFTDEEVDVLYEKYTHLCKKLQVPRNGLQNWYDGYSFENGISIYSPRSVVSCMRFKKIGNYWNQTETFEALRIYIDMNFEGLKDDVLSMIAGNAVPVNIGNFSNDMATFHSEDDVLTLLIHLGYVSYDYDSKTVKIPNEEVRAEYVNSVSASNWGEVSKSLKNSADTLEAIWQKRPKQVAEAISQAHFETSHIQYNDENALSYTISLALYSARNFYMIYRELPSGKGFADLVFLPRKKFPEKPAIVVELKWDKDVSGAIAQIKNKEYCRSLEEYRGNVLLVGVNYDKKTKVHECMIEECEIW